MGKNSRHDGLDTGSKMSLKERAKALKTLIPAIFIALSKKETPLSAKIFAGITIAYALSPIDLIPDFIPLLGYLDDLLILPALAALTIKCIPKVLFERCKAEAEGLWENGKPKKWCYAVPVIIFWVLITALIAWLITKNIIFSER